ncbi:isochorismatase domain-containing protein 2 isoform X1 [Nematostella vectensis]|uniref:isochorismatase domain-containing protein 2 isoform X1 n=1 Tax=Nematostella vectensis TaxID=45351 RepID=UPI002077106B|nr:isochorismatase domain-containing protein 2 isoform X1 [Nematostella vectensis]
MAGTRSGKLFLDSTVFFMCDMQEDFRRFIAYFPDITTVAKRMVDSAKILDIPVLATEHNPQGPLGPTVEDIDTSFFKDNIFPKHTLSMLGCEEFANKFHKMSKNVKAVVLFGVMADICIFNTSLDLVDEGFDVHVDADGVSSKHNCERMIALERLRQSGVFVSTSKSILLHLMKDTSLPFYEEVRLLANNAPPDQGLINAQ